MTDIVKENPTCFHAPVFTRVFTLFSRLFSCLLQCIAKFPVSSCFRYLTRTAIWDCAIWDCYTGPLCWIAKLDRLTMQYPESIFEAGETQSAERAHEHKFMQLQHIPEEIPGKDRNHVQN